jgi:hypothetical protein
LTIIHNEIVHLCPKEKEKEKEKLAVLFIMDRLIK